MLRFVDVDVVVVEVVVVVDGEVTIVGLEFVSDDACGGFDVVV